MTNKEKKLVDKYFHYREEESKYVRLQTNTLNELKECAPHKKGEIFSWLDNGVEKRGVVNSIYPLIRSKWDGSKTLDYLYGGSSIRKDGKLGRDINPPVDDDTFKWTGEVYKVG